MVKDGQLVGILDWEHAAYYPVWYEYISATWGFTKDELKMPTGGGCYDSVSIHMKMQKVFGWICIL